MLNVGKQTEISCLRTKSRFQNDMMSFFRLEAKQCYSHFTASNTANTSLKGNLWAFRNTQSPWPRRESFIAPNRKNHLIPAQTSSAPISRVITTQHKRHPPPTHALQTSSARGINPQHKQHHHLDRKPYFRKSVIPWFQDADHIMGSFLRKSNLEIAFGRWTLKSSSKVRYWFFLRKSKLEIAFRR